LVKSLATPQNPLPATGTPITRTFPIQNTGNVALSLVTGPITLSGANPSLFRISNIVLPATVSGPSSMNFV